MKLLRNAVFALLPDLPPVGETVPGYNFAVCGGLIAPAIVNTLNAAVNKVLATPAIRDQMMGLGLEPFPATVEEFRKFAVKQHGQWGRSIKDAGIQPE